MDDYFIPDIYAELNYIICPQVTGWRCTGACGEIDVQIGRELHIDGIRCRVAVLLGEIADADEGRFVAPLIVGFEHPDGYVVHYGIVDELPLLDLRPVM